MTVACPKCEASECRCRQPYTPVRPGPLPVKCYGERIVRCVMDASKLPRWAEGTE